MLTPFCQSQFYNKNHENQFHTFTRPQTFSIQHDAGETAVTPQFHSQSSMNPILGMGQSRAKDGLFRSD